MGDEGDFEIVWEVHSKSFTDKPYRVSLQDVTGNGQVELLAWFASGFRLNAKSLWVFGVDEEGGYGLISPVRKSGEDEPIYDFGHFEDIEDPFPDFYSYFNINDPNGVTGADVTVADLDGDSMLDTKLVSTRIFDEDGKEVYAPLWATYVEGEENVYTWEDGVFREWGGE